MCVNQKTQKRVKGNVFANQKTLGDTFKDSTSTRESYIHVPGTVAASERVYERLTYAARIRASRRGTNRERVTNMGTNEPCTPRTLGLRRRNGLMANFALLRVGPQPPV